MSFTILDGKGSGKEAKVDTNNRLTVNSISESQADLASDVGDNYNLNTGVINLTNAAASAVFYFKNNENSDYSITSLIYNLGTSTNGVAEAQVDVYFKTTGGTIVSGASDVDMNANLNLGSANTLLADAYKGAQGNTQTGGTISISTLVSPSTRTVISIGKIVIPKGQTMSVVITPPTSNTSMDVQVALVGYLATAIVTGI